MARTVSVVLAVTLLSIGLTTAHAAINASPARAHARVVGTSPENHAHIDAPPERVTILLEGKPITVEGDPLRVYGPTGERVDAGDVLVEEGENGEPAELSVALSPDTADDMGEYNVVYRVVSRDTHLVAGRFMFHLGEADSAAVLPIGSSPSRPERLAYGWPADRAHWPKLLCGVAVVLALIGWMFQRWRRSRRASTVETQTVSSGLFAGRRLD